MIKPHGRRDLRAWLEVAKRPAVAPRDGAGGSAHWLSTILSVHGDCQERNCSGRRAKGRTRSDLAGVRAGGAAIFGRTGKGFARESEPGSGAICRARGESAGRGAGG